MKRQSSSQTTNPIGPSYRYSPLRDGWTRLVRLMPHRSRRAPIQCQLIDYPIVGSCKGAHLYEALSYVWGSPEKRQVVHVGDSKLCVTENLFGALTRLRDRFLERIIWIDALCINQDDNNERGRQVQMMAEIYARASRVVVWLEDCSREVDNEDISNVNLAIGVIGMAARNEVDLDKCWRSESFKLALSSLFERPWFQRIWVLQEVAAARSVLIMCHGEELDGNAFCAGLKALGFGTKESTVTKESDAESDAQSEAGSHAEADMSQHSNVQSRVRSVTFLISSASLRHRQLGSKPNSFSLDICSLSELANMYHDREASDPRDKIYALLGMADNVPTGLTPDYNLPWEDVFPQFVKSLVSEQISVSFRDRVDIAIIKARGCVLGHISKVYHGEPWDTTQRVGATPTSRPDSFTLVNSWTTLKDWSIRIPARAIRFGDIIFLPEGASAPLLIRIHTHHCSVVAIAFSPADDQGVDFDWSSIIYKLESLPNEVPLVWNLKHPGYGLEEATDVDWHPTLLEKATGLEACGMLLISTYKDRREEASKRLERALIDYEKALGIRNPRTLAVMDVLAELYYTDGIYSNRSRSDFLTKSDILQIKSDILARRGEYAEFTERAMVRVVELFGLDMLMVFLGTFGEAVTVTQKVFEAVFSSGYGGKRPKMLVLLERGGDRLAVTEKVLKMAVSDGYEGPGLIEELLQCRSGEVVITEDVLKAVVASSSYDRMRMIKYLLDSRGEDITITEDVLIDLCTSGGVENTAIMKLLLDWGGTEVVITEHVLKATIRGFDSRDIMELLMGKWGDQVVVTENILEAAVECRWWYSLFHLFFDRRGDQLLQALTEKALKAVISSSDGFHILKMLLDWGKDKVNITEGALKAIVQCYYWKWTLEAVIGSQGGKIVLTKYVLEGVGTEKWNEIREMVLCKKSGDRDVVIEDIDEPRDGVDDTSPGTQLVDNSVSIHWATPVEY